MKSIRIIFWAWVSLVLVTLNLPAQTDSGTPLVISADQVAAAFGYHGKLQSFDFASKGLTNPDTVQEINFTASDATFLETNVTVATAGTLIPPNMRDAWEKAPDVSPPGQPPFRKARLPDGTTAYLLAMGGPGGDGFHALMTSKDGRFDLAISVTMPSGGELQQTPTNRAYDEAMTGAADKALAKLAFSVQQIYPIVVANYSAVASKIAKHNQSNPNQALLVQSTSSPISPVAVPNVAVSPSPGIQAVVSHFPKRMLFFFVLVAIIVIGAFIFRATRR